MESQLKFLKESTSSLKISNWSEYKPLKWGKFIQIKKEVF